MSRRGRAGHFACLLAILPACDYVFRFDERVDAPPEAALTWLAVSAGGSHTCAIKSDSSLWCWGKNNHGQLGLGTTVDEIVPARVGAEKWRSVTAGVDYTCGIKPDGSLWCWGENEEAELGIGNRNSTVTPVRVGTDNNWRAVSLGSAHTCGVRDDDSLWCWGSDGRGALGNGDVSNSIVQSPERIAPSTAWSQVAVAIDASCAITTSGELYCWGRNEHGELGNGQTNTNSAQTTPLRVGTDAGWSAIATRGGDFLEGSNQVVTHVCGVRAGLAYCWGANRAGQTGRPSSPSITTPEKLDQGFTQISVGAEHTCGLVDDALYCWGRNERGELGIGLDTGLDTNVPTRIPGTWSSVSNGFTHTCALDTAGALHCTGTNDRGELGDSAGGPRNVPVLLGSGYDELAVGAQHACARRGAALECWGRNRGGQLAAMPRAPRQKPALSYMAPSAILQTAAGDDHTCVRLTLNGVLQCWGGDADGSLGNGAAGATHTPTNVTHVRAWDRISTGSHTCATDVDANNNGWCWGNNASGELGDMTNSSKQTPTALGPSMLGGKYTQIYAGLNHSCGLRINNAIDNEVWCWGSNNSGQLGFVGGGTTVPMAAKDENLAAQNTMRARMLALGDTHTCATGIEDAPAARRLFCWGANGSSQIGDGTETGRSRPVVIGTGYIAVAAGRAHSCAIKNTGALECWGHNAAGQLGDGSFTLKTRPSAVLSSATWASIAAREDYTCGLTTMGDLYCWGLNHFGRVGDGTAWRNSFEPVSTR